MFYIYSSTLDEDNSPLKKHPRARISNNRDVITNAVRLHDVNSAEILVFRDTRLYSLLFISALTRGIELRCAAKLRYRTRRFARFEERSRDPCVFSAVRTVCEHARREVEQRRRRYIIIIIVCDARRQSNDADRQHSTIAISKEKE